MKLKTLLAAIVAVGSMASYQAAYSLDLNAVMDVGGKAFKAATFSDADARALADQACPYMDAEAKIAPASSPYTKRLDAIARKLNISDVNGVKPNYKVYLTNDVNAFAMANGCIRVYSGLMDLMTDDEVMGVVGHEIGHVALGHTRKRYQVAYSTAAARSAAAVSGNSTVATLSSSELGDLTENLLHAQYSQSNETASDNYSYDLLMQRNLPTAGLVTAFEKLAKLGGGDSSMFDSHPPSKKRAANIEKRIKKDAKK